MPKVILVSFGYLHSTPPPADITIDVRERLRDPAAAAEILDLDGRDERVMRIVARTPGATGLIAGISHLVRAWTLPECVVAVGCAGGRHRSVALVELVAARLLGGGYMVRVEHPHVGRPRIILETALVS